MSNNRAWRAGFRGRDFLAHSSLMPSKLAGGKCKGRLVHQISMRPPSISGRPRGTSGRIRTRLRTPHPCHVPRVRGVRGAFHPTNGGAEAGAGHSNRCLSMPLPNSTGPLFPVLESGTPGSRRGHTHTHSHMGWNIAASCLGCSQGGAGLAGRCCVALTSGAPSFSLARTVLIVRTMISD